MELISTVKKKIEPSPSHTKQMAGKKGKAGEINRCVNRCEPFH